MTQAYSNKEAFSELSPNTVGKQKILIIMFTIIPTL